MLFKGISLSLRNLFGENKTYLSKKITDLAINQIATPLAQKIVSLIYHPSWPITLLKMWEDIWDQIQSGELFKDEEEALGKKESSFAKLCEEDLSIIVEFFIYHFISDAGVSISGFEHIDTKKLVNSEWSTKGLIKDFFTSFFDLPYLLKNEVVKYAADSASVAATNKLVPNLTKQMQEAAANFLNETTSKVDINEKSLKFIVDSNLSLLREFTLYFKVYELLLNRGVVFNGLEGLKLSEHFVRGLIPIKLAELIKTSSEVILSDDGTEKSEFEFINCVTSKMFLEQWASFEDSQLVEELIKEK